MFDSKEFFRLYTVSIVYEKIQQIFVKYLHGISLQ